MAFNWKEGETIRPNYPKRRSHKRDQSRLNLVKKLRIACKDSGEKLTSVLLIKIAMILESATS